jgi:tetratricopeptide (TPR) repeat protein
MARIFFLVRGSFRASLVSILLLGSVFCLSVQASEPAWVKVSSAHFSVLTDAGEKKGREVVLRFEQMRAVFGQLFMKTKLILSQPLDIIALKSDEEYIRVAPIRERRPISAPGFFLAGTDRDYIVLDLSADESWRAVARPFALVLLNYNYPPTQDWFDEGLAAYFSSLRIDNKQAQIGGDPELNFEWRAQTINPASAAPNQSSLAELLQGQWLAIADLFTTHLNGAGSEQVSHHTLFGAESWMVMHYLLNQDKLSEAGTYFGLVQIHKMPVDRAIQQAFGMTPAQLEEAVKNYFHALGFPSPNRTRLPPTNAAGPVHQFSPPFGPDDLGASVQPVSENDAQSLVAEMALRLPEHREQAAKRLQGLASDPKTENAITHRALGWFHIEAGEFEHATDELSKAAELNARDPWVRFYLALAKYREGQPTQEYHGLSNMIQDLRAVLDWNNEFAEAYHMLAMARLEGGGIHSASESIRQAIQLSPRSEQYLLTLARIYEAEKQWDQASALLERLSNSRDSKILEAARQSLEELPTLKKYGVLPQRNPSARGPRAVTESEHSQPSAQETEGSADDTQHESTAATEPLIDKRKVQFLKGRLIAIDCSASPVAVLTIAAGTRTMKLRTENYKSLPLIGADEFSCAWKNRLVSINYRAGGKIDGDLVSLELR